MHCCEKLIHKKEAELTLDGCALLFTEEHEGIFSLQSKQARSAIVACTCADACHISGMPTSTCSSEAAINQLLQLLIATECSMIALGMHKHRLQSTIGEQSGI
jgi:hypothetical protein